MRMRWHQNLELPFQWFSALPPLPYSKNCAPCVVCTYQIPEKEMAVENPFSLTDKEISHFLVQYIWFTIPISILLSLKENNSIIPKIKYFYNASEWNNILSFQPKFLVGRIKY